MLWHIAFQQILSTYCVHDVIHRVGTSYNSQVIHFVQSLGLEMAGVCVCTDCLSLSLCCRLQCSGQSLIIPLPSPSSTYTGKVSVVSKVVGQEMQVVGRWANPLKRKGDLQGWLGFPLPSGILFLRGHGCPVGRVWGGGWSGTGKRSWGAVKKAPHVFSPFPGYLSLSKVVPFSHYAGTLLLLLAGVACLRGRWKGSLVWVCSFNIH